MRVDELKDYILNNDCVETILEELGCGNIRDHGGYFTCSNPDGNNAQAVTVYKENLITVNYTRNITKNKRAADIFDLVSFYNECTFPEALKYVHDVLGLDYYSEQEDVPVSLQLLRMLKDMNSGSCDEDSAPLKPIPEKILSYYLPYGNKMFEDDNISLEVQKEFGIGYDPQTNRITIPIRDGLNNLVGVKGRLFGEPDEYNQRYLYLSKCNKARILYGYAENQPYIKRSDCVYVVESEKGVMQAATYGHRNVVSTGGKTISKTQVEMLTRLGCKIIFAYDEDVKIEELQDITNMFMDGIQVFALVDKEGLLDEKQSPTDDSKKFEHMIKNNLIQLK